MKDVDAAAGASGVQNHSVAGVRSGRRGSSNGGYLAVVDEGGGFAAGRNREKDGEWEKK